MATQEETLPQHPEVFLNFRRDELRNGFISHLKRALKRNGITVHYNRGLMTGAENIFKGIEESRIALAIFSSRYTESKWCLDELVKIKERVDEGKLVVIPVFYKLTVSTVKYLKGEFGVNIWNIAKFYSDDTIEEWKEALYYVSQRFGLVFDGKSDLTEAYFINTIVEQVKIVIDKSHDYWLDEDYFEGVDGERDGILWDTKTDRDPILEAEAKSRRDDGLNLSKDDNFLGESNSSSTLVKLPPNHQMLRYEFLIHLVKALKSYKITSQLGMIIACLLLLFFCLPHIANISKRLLGAGCAIDRIVENVPKVVEYIPAEPTEIPRDKFTEFSTEIYSHSPMDGKVKPPNIQVFINFRGEQLRNNFVGYLVDALRRSGINVFIDYHEQRGEDLNTLFKRIEDSGIAIVVFLSRYTESKWCLEELVKIKERVHQGLLKVLPIFYKVTPGNVKRLKGEFGDHFRDKEYMYASEEPKIKRWKEAIVFVSHKFALNFDEKSSVLEIDFIETIVKEVLKMLQAISKVKSCQSCR